MLYTKPEIRAALLGLPIGGVWCDHSQSPVGCDSALDYKY